MHVPDVEHTLDFSGSEAISWEELEADIRARDHEQLYSNTTPKKTHRKIQKNPGIEIIKMKLLIVQMFLRACAIGWATQTVLSPKSWYQEQVQHGMNFPIDVTHQIGEIASLAKNTLSEIPQDAGVFEKIGIHYQNTKELGSYITSQVQEILDSLSHGKTNITENPLETLHAAIGVAALYFVLSEVIGFVRLWDSDTLSARVRKRAWKILSQDTSSKNITQKEVISTFEDPDIPMNKKREQLRIFLERSQG